MQFYFYYFLLTLFSFDFTLLSSTYAATIVQTFNNVQLLNAFTGLYLSHNTGVPNFDPELPRPYSNGAVNWGQQNLVNI